MIRFWLHASHAAEDARKQADACLKCARDAHQRIELLQAAIHARDVTQAERLVSREVLREVENRLAESIDRLGDRLIISSARWSRFGASTIDGSAPGRAT